MQQSSSLPEQNSQIDETSKILPTNQQLRDTLWLESSLNGLQSRLHELLLSANTLPQIISTEVEILQTVVNETANALNNSLLYLTHYSVGIVQCQPQDIVAKIFYVSNSVNTGKSNPEVIAKAKTKQGLKLQATIKLTDLQKMERQKPANAWRLADNSSGIMSWLIISTAELNAHNMAQNSSFMRLRSQFIQRIVEYCNTSLAQLRQIQFWQQRCQQLANFNQELERTNQLKNQFLANTSHEINWFHPFIVSTRLRARETTPSRIFTYYPI
jgi:signal transduction histidine kinase